MTGSTAIHLAAHQRVWYEIIRCPESTGRRKRLPSTLLVQAVPHASRVRQMVCGQGLAMVGAFTPPGNALSCAAPCSTSSLN